MDCITKMVMLIPLLFCLSTVHAQEKYDMKLSVEAGTLLFSDDSHNLGLFLTVEPKIKLLENSYLGVRFGLTLNSHTFENEDGLQFRIGEDFDNAVLSFVPTFDYYVPIHTYKPYIGVGVGNYVVPHSIDVFRGVVPNPFEVALAGNVNKRIGFLIRGGLERRKLRLGLEYNFVPKTDITLLTGQVIGTVDNSYVGLSIGFVLGGKKDKEESIY